MHMKVNIQTTLIGQISQDTGTFWGVASFVQEAIYKLTLLDPFSSYGRHNTPSVLNSSS